MEGTQRTLWKSSEMWNSAVNFPTRAIFRLWKVRWFVPNVESRIPPSRKLTRLRPLRSTRSRTPAEFAIVLARDARSKIHNRELCIRALEQSTHWSWRVPAFALDPIMRVGTGNSFVSFIMSEKIQISFESAWDSSDLGDDSNKALRCHNPPKMSVPDDSGPHCRGPRFEAGSELTPPG